MKYIQNTLLHKIMILGMIVFLGTVVLGKNASAQAVSYDPNTGTYTQVTVPPNQTVPPATAADLPPTCNPYVYNGMRDQGIMNSQKRSVIAQMIYTRPDSAAHMVCLGQQFMTAAQTIGSIFTDNPQFAGSCGVGNMSGATVDAILNTMAMVTSAYNLGGGVLQEAGGQALNAVLNAGANALATTATNAITNQVGSALGNLFGSCWGGLATNVVNGVIESAFNDLIEGYFGANGCNAMDQVWQGVALRNVNPQLFMTNRQLRTQDPRLTINSFFNSNGQPTSLQNALGLTIQDGGSFFDNAFNSGSTNALIAGGAYTPPPGANQLQNLVSTPRSEALTMGGGMGGNGCNWVQPGGLGTICNAGCTTQGGSQATPCVPE